MKVPDLGIGRNQPGGRQMLVADFLMMVFCPPAKQAKFIEIRAAVGRRAACLYGQTAFYLQLL